MTPVEVVLGGVEKYHAPALVVGVPTQGGVEVKGAENVWAVVVVPVVLETVPVTVGCTALTPIFRLDRDSPLFALVAPKASPTT